MTYSLFLPTLIVLIYLPIFLFATLSNQFKQKFMKVHSKDFKQYAIESLAGIIYFVIIIVSAYTTISTNNTNIILGLLIYITSIEMTYIGYLSFIKTHKNKLTKNFPYNISRNPTYFFGLTAILGIAILTMSNTLIVLLLIQFALTHKIILNEEKYLEKKYKKEYGNYKKKVRRYF